MLLSLVWLEAHLPTVLVGVALVALLTAVILYLIRVKKHGKTTCGCGCAGCPMKDSCHTDKK